MNPAVISVRTIATALFAAAVAALLAPVAVSAQSPEEAREIARGRFQMIDERYEITVDVVPSVPSAGTVHFVVTPNLVETEEAVTDATILIVIDDEEGVPTYQSIAPGTPGLPGQYRANFLVERAGDWKVRVELEAPAGDAQLTLPLVVIDRNITGGLGGTLVFVVVAVVLAGGGLYVALMARRKMRDRSIR